MDCEECKGRAQELLLDTLASYVSRVAEKLRAQGSVCGRMQIFLQTNLFQPHQPQAFPAGEVVLPTPTNFTPELVTAAAGVLERIWKPGFSWKKVGVMLLELGPEVAVQSAFDSAAPEVIDKRRRAMIALDAVNRLHGRATVRVASAAGPVPTLWKMRQAKLSPCYTTRWSDLPVAAA
jgi:DNA polymerase V